MTFSMSLRDGVGSLTSATNTLQQEGNSDVQVAGKIQISGSIEVGCGMDGCYIDGWRLHSGSVVAGSRYRVWKCNL